MEWCSVAFARCSVLGGSAISPSGSTSHHSFPCKQIPVIPELARLTYHKFSMVAAAKYAPYYEPVIQSTLLPKTVLPIKTFAGVVPDAYQQQAYGFAGIFNGVDSMICKL